MSRYVGHGGEYGLALTILGRSHLDGGLFRLLSVEGGNVEAIHVHQMQSLNDPFILTNSIHSQSISAAYRLVYGQLECPCIGFMVLFGTIRKQESVVGHPQDLRPGGKSRSPPRPRTTSKTSDINPQID